MQRSILSSRSARAFVSVAGLMVAGGLGVGAAVIAASDRPAAPAPLAAPAAEGTYSFDPAHSSVVFSIRHLGTSNTWGMFHEPTGTFVAGPKGSIEISVPLDKLDTGNEKRDQHLRSPDFFSAKEFPTITYKSKSITPAGENAYDVTGELTLHGQTKPLNVKLEILGAGKGMKGEDIIGAQATFTIKRSEWGMNTYVKEGAVGDEVNLTVAFEGHKQ
ncbi:MAG: polyisoprenoid-binding protein [Tepidisphaera sp.]|nr:polyisoprenoid-binding protein [Tepidisphaera sp.]